MTAMDKVGDGIGGDIGFGVSELANTAKAALDNVRDAVRAMSRSVTRDTRDMRDIRGKPAPEDAGYIGRSDIVIRLPYDEVDPLHELDDDVGSVIGMMRLLRAAAGPAKDCDFSDGALVIAEHAIMMMENAREIVARLDAGR